MGAFGGQEYFLNARRLFFEEQKQLCESKGRMLATIKSREHRDFIINLMERTEIPFHLMAKCNLTTKSFDWFNGDSTETPGYFYTSYGRLRRGFMNKCVRSSEIIFYDPLNMRRLPNPKGWGGGAICVSNSSAIITSSSFSERILDNITSVDPIDTVNNSTSLKTPSQFDQNGSKNLSVEFEILKRKLFDRIDSMNQTINTRIQLIESQVRENSERLINLNGSLISYVNISGETTDRSDQRN